MESQEPSYRGKVRDLYDLGQNILLVSTDRLSAFDVVFPDTIPGKGIILNQVSSKWFQWLRKSGLQEELGFKDHWISASRSDFPSPFNTMPDLEGRSSLVKKTQRIDFECVVRGYIAGSGWKDYQKNGAICGIELPAGLRLGDRLPEPIFTPATKAEVGDHDENVGFEVMEKKLGELAHRLKEISISIFKAASELMATRDILLCDTKFEFGLLNDEIYLIDEMLTPDSSRYWDASKYEPGKNQAGFDKQYIRDYVEELGWDKTPPAPKLPKPVILNTVSLYEEIKKRIDAALDSV
ncbi:MAG: phosphoribosylaminoimidazolesuccinocarboxamide synthase [Spirochaetaceae bacterium]|nr:phosphoribosylaminoimidazolesuccinocarboxamide synthase [Spirochaetaceae bacterium]|tara:strand:+ start:15584 stop:16468 length:885 start_codon:yes stop_codon:yes gene_type:complete